VGRITPISEQVEDDEMIERFRRQSAVSVIVPPELHPDTKQLVAVFAEELARKLRASEVKRGYGNDWLVDDWRDKCRRDLLSHLAKGDPLDVAVYCAFLWARDWPIGDVRVAPDVVVK
jgi:hypothetical protein